MSNLEEPKKIESDNISPKTVANTDEKTEESKYTRGETCIIYFIISLIVVIVILLVIFVVHILLIEHNSFYEVFKITDAKGTKPLDYLPCRSDVKCIGVGIAFLKSSPVEIVCVTLLINEIWSLAPAHCVATRSDPELAKYLSMWKIGYKSKTLHESDIKRSIAHPHFNRDDFSNNIGLFQHLSLIQIDSFLSLNIAPLYEDSLKTYGNELLLAGWKSTRDFSNSGAEMEFTETRLEMTTKCKNTLSPITELRNYEFCVKGTDMYQGAVLVTRSRKTLGIFVWGETSAPKLPLVVLNISYFKNWYEEVTAV